METVVTPPRSILTNETLASAEPNASGDIHTHGLDSTMPGPGDATLRSDHAMSPLGPHGQTDIDMDNDHSPNRDVSDVESDDDPHNERPKKKAKGQRFFCTGYPPCTLSFTRSEHLARHIRKHTGERPYGCPCGRFFSRLDNLRQHAQTVHQCEDIPPGAVATTGARYPRQIRADRANSMSGRPRASTLHSFNAPTFRSHGRTLSTSSVASTVSTMSMRSSEPRSRPVSLHVPDEQLSLLRGPPNFSPPSVHATFAYGYFPSGPQTSVTGPRARHLEQSTMPFTRPTFDFERPSGIDRRLSFPASAATTDRAGSAFFPSFRFPAEAGTSGAVDVNDQLRSPSSAVPVVSPHRRSESEQDPDWRRRTWHSGALAAYTPRRATSSLVYQQTPDDCNSRPSSQSAASQVTRLPGIASFDHGPSAARHSRRASSVSMRPGHARLPSLQAGSSPLSPAAGDEKRAYPQWESGLHHNLDRLDIATSPRSPRANATRPVSEHLPRAPLFTDSGPSRARWPSWQSQSQRPISRPVNILDRPNSATSSSEGIPTPGTSYDYEANPTIVAMSDQHTQLLPTSFSEEQQPRQIYGVPKPDPIRTDSATQIQPTSASVETVYALPPPSATTMPPPSSFPTRPDLERLNTLASVSSTQGPQSRS